MEGSGDPATNQERGAALETSKVCQRWLPLPVPRIFWLDIDKRRRAPHTLDDVQTPTVPCYLYPPPDVLKALVVVCAEPECRLFLRVWHFRVSGKLLQKRGYL